MMCNMIIQVPQRYSKTSISIDLGYKLKIHENGMTDLSQDIIKDKGKLTDFDVFTVLAYLIYAFPEIQKQIPIDDNGNKYLIQFKNVII